MLLLEQRREDRFLQDTVERVERNYNFSFNHFVTVANLFYRNNELKISEIMKNAYKSDEREKALLREKLLSRFNKFYNTNRDIGLKQFHFHLPNGDSFLRFHRKEKFGDNLFKHRHSIKVANTKYLYLSGFEEGKIFNGFRNVYPLFYNGEHIGSFEVSFCFDSLRYIMSNNQANTHFTMLLDRAVVDKKLFRSELKNYKSSDLSSQFMIEQSLTVIKRDDIAKIDNILKSKDISEDMRSFKKFAKIVSFDDKRYIVSFLPLINIQKQKVGYIISYTKETKELAFIDDYLLHYFFGLIIILALFCIVNMSLKYHLNIRKILDYQKDIVLITDGKSPKFANLAFFEFFKFKDLNDFQSQHDCICEFFEDDKNYLSTDMNGVYWIDYICQNPVMEHKAKILSRVFLLNLNKISGEYIISMTDITESEKEKILKDEILVQQSKMAQMGEMIGAIAHQWKQPLNSIALISQSISFELELEDIDIDSAVMDKINKNTEDIMQQVTFMDSTVNDFRKFLSPNREKKSFSIEKAINSIVNILKAQLKSRNIDVTIYKREEFDDSIFSYENEFKQVILNLLNNSKDAIEERFNRKERGNIDVKLSKDGESIYVKISDNGGGSEVVEKIFQSYFTTKGEKGTGIGLYISKNIVEKHLYGKLSAQNIDEGLEFTIELNSSLLRQDSH
jgi:signal transduction histidine kinase